MTLQRERLLLTQSGHRQILSKCYASCVLCVHAGDGHEASGIYRPCRQCRGSMAARSAYSAAADAGNRICQFRLVRPALPTVPNTLIGRADEVIE